MTQTEFINQYCERSNITEKALNTLGRFAMPCDCKEEGCKGWAMISKEQLEHQVTFCISHD